MRGILKKNEIKQARQKEEEEEEEKTNNNNNNNNKKQQLGQIQTQCAKDLYSK